MIARQRVRKFLWGVFAVASVLVWASCSTAPEEEKADVRVENGVVFIVDRTGKKWDVTHAVNKYGFVAENFQFGLGPKAIQPIQNPTFVLPGQDGYPSDDNTMIVIGTEIGGDSRAYAISQLNRHEIANDKFGDVHVSVGW